MIKSAEQRKQMKEAQRERAKQYRKRNKANVSDIIGQLKEKAKKQQPTTAQLEYKEKQREKAKQYRHEQYLKQKAYKKEYLKKCNK